MTPARRQTIEAALAIIADVNDADAWDMLTAETHRELIRLGATIGETETPTDDEDLAFVMTLEGVTALSAPDNGEHLLLRWAANARRALAESDGDPDEITGCADDRSPLGRAIGTCLASEELD